MYLKSIEVQGFKSFAHKIVFEFHNGITAIVGPNGSGKSNVADAVRWVLGEQRVKQLRGGSMQDVIFSGTENRRPLSYASVAITLDNADHQLAVDYKEVTVTRKLYRSGESEYLLNGHSCRLKDINELFYDTGIGKEGYSIIGQGQIDKILSGKPEERRELFDEAAGIVKYKRRKNMSIKKLESERQNLVRVNDILSELERQFEPLKRQSDVAREYLKKKEELKIYDINMFLLETARLKEQIDDIDKKLSISQSELDEANQAYVNMKVEYEEIEEQIDVIEAAIEKSKSQRNESTLLKQQLENQIELLKEQINSARMNDEHYELRAVTVRAEIEARQEQINSLIEEKKSIKEQLDTKAGLDEEAKKSLFLIQSEIAELSTLIEVKKNDIIELLNSRASTKAKIQRYDTMLEQINVRKAQLNQKLIEAVSDAEEQKQLSQTYEEELKTISGEIAAYIKTNQEHEQQIEDLQQQIAKQNEQLNIGQKTYHREHSRLESLKNITERYDGYGNSIRKVMEQKEKEPGLLGVVADIIKVDKKYEIAIETALGGSIQNIVTTNENTAKKMISYLKQNRFGRATFLPISTVNGRANVIRLEVLNESGVIGVANTLTQADAQFQGVVNQLLGRTLVVDTIDTGIGLARKYKQTLRIVTLEGELINPGGSMAGGAFKNSSNLLSRRREIEEFEKTVKMLKQELQEAEEAVEKLKSRRTELYSAIEAVKKKLQEAYVIQNTSKMNLDQVNAKQQSAIDSADSLRRESEDLIRQTEEIQENQESIHVELETSESLEENLKCEIETGQKELEEKRVMEASEQAKSEEVHLAYAGLQQKYAFSSENIQRIQEEIDKFNQELNDVVKNKGTASEEIVAKEREIDELHTTIENSKDVFEEINAEIKEKEEKRETLNLKNKSFMEKRDRLSKHIADLDKEIFRLTNRKEGYQENSEKQIDYMWEEYELTYSYALELRDEALTDLAFMKKRIGSLKAEIRGLGDVNVNAIEEFKELSERYEFLKTQHDDLIEAEATLVKIIDELDAAMRKQFTESFEEISKEFDKVFKELFGGGKGTLELQEDEDILEAGILIIAQPPGKKLQNMMQLSGGEKALTAISLLFAIQNLKPSPFCLLDEIEAALDDSNVGRFARYLCKLTKNTQFIVITHRRGTMAEADRLYGITMQEKGISTLVSVDLLEDKLDK